MYSNAWNYIKLSYLLRDHGVHSGLWMPGVSGHGRRHFFKTLGVQECPGRPAASFLGTPLWWEMGGGWVGVAWRHSNNRENRPTRRIFFENEMKSREINWNWMKSNEFEWNQVKLIEVKWNQLKWNQMKWNEAKWKQAKSNETKWNQMKSIEIKWNHMTSNEIKWNELKSSETKWIQASPSETPPYPLIRLSNFSWRYRYTYIYIYIYIYIYFFLVSAWSHMSCKVRGHNHLAPR